MLESLKQGFFVLLGAVTLRLYQKVTDFSGFLLDHGYFGLAIWIDQHIGLALFRIGFSFVAVVFPDVVAKELTKLTERLGKLEEK